MSNLIKYPRTYHLPWSEGYSSDDKVLRGTEHFDGKEIVVTEKMDGENTSLYRDYYHARSLDSRHHPSRDWLKAFHASFASNIPEGWRVCGENLFAKHSIYYEHLRSYFYAFSLWEGEQCKPWDESVEWFDLLGVECVPVLYRGIYDEKILKELAKRLDTEHQEGYVVRLIDGFSYESFNKSVAKFVRRNHVNTDEHWMQSAVTQNRVGE